MSTPAAPIPIPIRQRWRDFRLRLVPPLVFAAAVVVLAFLWKDYVAAPTLTGQAEAVLLNVSSSKPGMLTQLAVNRFQSVRAGDALGQVLVTDPKILASSLAVIQAEIENLRVTMAPIAVQQRTSMNYDHLLLDWMQDRSKLAMAKVNLQLASAEFHRMGELYKDKIVSERVFEQAQAGEERLRKEVEELTTLVQEQERNTRALQPTNTGAHDLASVSEEPLHAAIAVQESKLRLTEAELSPIILRAPADGMVSVILHRSGEAITAGDPIVSVSVLNPVRIIGYLRAPMPREPHLGMSVMVRTRGPHRESGLAKIVGIGTQLEPIAPALLPALKPATVELGLPIAVSLPLSLKIRGGELVDLTLMPDTE